MGLTWKSKFDWDSILFRVKESHEMRMRICCSVFNVSSKGVNPGGDGGGGTHPTHFLEWGGRIPNYPPQFLTC